MITRDQQTPISDFMTPEGKRKQIIDTSRGRISSQLENYGHLDGVYSVGELQVKTDVINTSPSGAVRESQDDKLRFDLIPPEGLEREALWFGMGAKRYTPRNWEKGLAFVRTLASMQRHLFAYLMRDNTEDHLAAIAWAAHALMFFEARIYDGELPSELDDRPNYKANKRRQK